MSDLIRHKCAMDQGFVRRFRLEREDKDKHLQQNFINDIRDKVLSGTGFDIDVEGDDKKLAIKESYLLACDGDKYYQIVDGKKKESFKGGLFERSIQ